VSVTVVAFRIGAARWRLAVWPTSARACDAQLPKKGVLAPAPSFNPKTSGSLVVSEAVVTSGLLPRPRCRIGRGSCRFNLRTSDGGSL
jgi:hypothetical protein